MMTTFYLKYRPQKISELDLGNIREQLLAIVKSKKIPHAFLFAGPRGAGKTSAARILAKVANCLASPKPSGGGREPCNRCSQCKSITNGSSLDVIEIDAASNRGVDDIRSLREAVKLTPSGSKKKVYIIDEAHMLTTEAANALLKTLEEPPSHVMFVLATTAPEKLPDTIRSRCTFLNFRKANKAEVARSLQKAVKGERLKVDKEALEEIAKSVDGSFREAHKILEQLTLTAGRKKITKSMVQALVSNGIINVEQLLAPLAKKDAKGALKEVDRAAKAGVNLKNYTSEIIGALRKMLLSKLGVEENAPDVEGLSSVEDIRKLVELFSEASTKLPTAIIPQLPLELAVVKWCETKNELGMKNHESGGKDRDTGQQVESKEAKSVPEISENRTTNESPATPLQSSELEQKWAAIREEVKHSNNSISALLIATRPLKFDGRNLEVEVFYQFHKERLEQDAYRKIIEKAASNILGVAPIRMSCSLSKTKQRAADAANITEEVEEDIVAAAEEIFGGKDNDIN